METLVTSAQIDAARKILAAGIIVHPTLGPYITDDVVERGIAAAIGELHENMQLRLKAFRDAFTEVVDTSPVGETALQFIERYAGALEKAADELGLPQGLPKAPQPETGMPAGWW